MTQSRSKVRKGGYTLIELIVAIGLFSIVMMLATGAYLVMIAANRQTQGLATGINNLSFVLDSVTTAMRTGSAYCEGGTYCTDGVAASNFSFIDQRGQHVRYGPLANPDGTFAVATCVGTTYCTLNTPLTDPAVAITSLRFVPTGTAKDDGLQPYVTIYIAGTVQVAPGKIQTFAVESSVIMRGTDI